MSPRLLISESTGTPKRQVTVLSSPVAVWENRTSIVLLIKYSIAVMGDWLKPVIAAVAIPR
jgi:hypothetical protein